MINKIILSLIISTLLLTACSTTVKSKSSESYIDLRKQIMEISQKCLPKPGTSLKEVSKIWDERVGHNLPFGEDIYAISINAHGHPGILSQVELHFSHEKQKIIKSYIVLENMNSNSVSIRDKVSFPDPWTEETYLKVSLSWVKVLHKTIEEKKKKLTRK